MKNADKAMREFSLSLDPSPSSSPSTSDDDLGPKDKEYGSTETNQMLAEPLSLPTPGSYRSYFDETGEQQSSSSRDDIKSSIIEHVLAKIMKNPLKIPFPLSPISLPQPLLPRNRILSMCSVGECIAIGSSDGYVRVVDFTNPQKSRILGSTVRAMFTCTTEIGLRDPYTELTSDNPTALMWIEDGYGERELSEVRAVTEEDGKITVSYSNGKISVWR
ncbi:hypothetical protein ADUPG1_000905 [Aduncisulcus paluster]|uniref:Uncharacterized protein n=1 Tax=Aduncisulcus paluster TaxID=2918883 RepID=A0ABQ5K8E9_9EUKA|nr:hypothetical protein ADUPG1_000905 [Aduncisulcus paluster]